MRMVKRRCIVFGFVFFTRDLASMLDDIGFKNIELHDNVFPGGDM